MNEIQLNSWTEFPLQIDKIRTDYGIHSLRPPDGREIHVQNEIIFRGQSDSKWGLTTTLERISKLPFTVNRYLERAESVVRHIESVTGKIWSVPAMPILRDEIAKNTDSLRPYLPSYEYLVYLRQLGFPSPLLDWTASPYIAAYFAFEQNVEAENCSIFAFIERPEGIKSTTAGQPQIKMHGPYVTTHSRHFAQKSWYTTATVFNAESKKHRFCPHSSIVNQESTEQDVLIKITIPRCHRIDVLKQLEDYNINHYTLFQTEDSLIKALGMKAFEIES